MTERPAYEPQDSRSQAPPGLDISGESEFAQIGEPLPAWLDRKLGYFGDARFVLFHWEPRADGVIWKDGHTYGFGPGAWRTFMERVIPLAESHGVDLGSEQGEGQHALVIDRLSHEAYFVGRHDAERFVRRQHR